MEERIHPYRPSFTPAQRDLLKEAGLKKAAYIDEVKAKHEGPPRPSTSPRYRGIIQAADGIMEYSRKSDDWLGLAEDLQWEMLKEAAKPCHDCRSVDLLDLLRSAILIAEMPIGEYISLSVGGRHYTLKANL